MSTKMIVIAAVGLVIFILVLKFLVFKKKKVLENGNPKGKGGKRKEWTLEEKKYIFGRIKGEMNKVEMSCMKNGQDNINTVVGVIVKRLEEQFPFSVAKEKIESNKPDPDVEAIIMENLKRACDGYPGSWTQSQMDRVFERYMNNGTNGAVGEASGYCAHDKKVQAEYSACTVRMLSNIIPVDILDKTSVPPSISELIQEIEDQCKEKHRCGPVAPIEEPGGLPEPMEVEPSAAPIEI